MKFTVGLAVLVSALALVSASPQCSIVLNEIPTKWASMTDECTNAMRAQIQMDINASYVYLEMGAYFSRDTVNRPGFAEFFFNSAKEDREHGSKLIEYLSMRGGLTSDVTNLITVPRASPRSPTNWTGVTALADALYLETRVSEAIRRLLSVCEESDINDYHQYQRQREIAGKLATLKQMEKAQGALAEFLFDKEL